MTAGPHDDRERHGQQAGELQREAHGSLDRRDERCRLDGDGRLPVGRSNAPPGRRKPAGPRPESTDPQPQRRWLRSGIAAPGSNTRIPSIACDRCSPTDQRARRSASALTEPSESATARSHGWATRSAHHAPSCHRSAPSFSGVREGGPGRRVGQLERLQDVGDGAADEPEGDAVGSIEAHRLDCGGGQPADAGECAASTMSVLRSSTRSLSCIARGVRPR